MREYKIGVGCGVLVFNDKGQFMMQKRLSKHRHGTYALPGGWLEFMENFEDLAKREVMEEAGVEIENVVALGATNNLFHDENIHTVSVVLASTMKKGQEVRIMEPEKCEKVVWFDDWNNLPEPLFCEYNKFISKEQVESYLKKK